jgi:hypothetical protein
MVPLENLYCFTRTECYVFVAGETAATSSYPRKLDGVRGAVGAKASCAYAGSALVGSDDGLWLVQKGNDYGAQPDQQIEVSKDVRGSWTWLLGSSPSTLVVRQWYGDIWCFNQSRYLHFTRDGYAIEGEWADEATVFDAASDPQYGMLLLLGSGQLGIIADCATDGGVDLAGEEGAEFRWQWESSHMETEVKAGRYSLSIETDDDVPDVKLKGVFDEGTTEVRVDKFSHDAAHELRAKVEEGSFPMPTGGRKGGLRGHMTLSGAGRDRVRALSVSIEMQAKRRGGNTSL